jgi:hypothetical protein
MCVSAGLVFKFATFGVELLSEDRDLGIPVPSAVQWD